MKNKYSIHFFGLPHTELRNEYNACAFTGKILRACQWFTEQGFETYAYGYPESDVICTHKIDISSLGFLEKNDTDGFRNHGYFYRYFEEDLEPAKSFHMEMIAKFRQLYNPGDVVFLIMGHTEILTETGYTI